MSAHAKRFALMVAALIILSIALVACQAPGTAVTAGPQSGNGVNVFRTPNSSLTSPTPTFPPFTVGAWPSNYSPGNNDNITIYVLCRVQDPTMNGPAKPPAQHLQVTIIVGAPVNQTYTGSTDNDGLAAIPLAINDSDSGRPVVVQASVNYGNATYTAQTFFTPAPAKPPTATPGSKGKPTPSDTVTVTVTTGP
jgi:hypothetical protein